MGHSKYTQEARLLAVQYYLTSDKGMSECAEELGLQDHDIKNWICRDEIEPAPEGVDAEDLKDAFLESVQKNEPKQEIWNSGNAGKRRFYRPTSSSLVYLK